MAPATTLDIMPIDGAFALVPPTDGTHPQGDLADLSGVLPEYHVLQQGGMRREHRNPGAWPHPWEWRSRGAYIGAQLTRNAVSSPSGYRAGCFEFLFLSGGLIKVTPS